MRRQHLLKSSILSCFHGMCLTQIVIILNMSLFLPFHQLTTLNLSFNCFQHVLGIQDGRSNSTFPMLETLDLSLNPYLNESIFKFLMTLTSVKNLNLSYCDIRGQFPIRELSVLRNFKQLDLSSNNLVGPLPIVQGRKSNSTFSMLEIIDLSWNSNMNESIIKPLSTFASLKNLNLARCNIKGAFPIQDGRSNSTFPMLETLDLSSNPYLNKSIFKFLTTLTSVKNLNLARCNISGPFPIQELSVLRNLKLLDLSFNYYLVGPLSKSQDIHVLSNLTKLRSLDLSGNMVDKSIFKYLIALPTLKSLFLSNNRGMNGTLTVTDLCKMIELEELDLSNNDLSGTLDASCLGNLTSLRALDLSYNSLSGSSIPPSLFAHLVNLELLSLSYNNFEGSFSLNFLANNSKLKVLSLGPMTNSKTFHVETENPPWIPSFQLEYLEMPSCQVNLPSRTIPTFLLYQHALKYVDLSNNNLVGMFPFWLLVNNSRLTRVSMNGNSFDELYLPSHLNRPFDQLLYLSLSNNKFQGNLPKNIGSLFPHLEHLDVSSNMFDGEIPISVGEMSHLMALDLSNNNFSGQIPEDILIGCIALRDLRLSKNILQGNIFPTPMNLGSLEIFLANNNQFNGTLLRDGVSLFRGWVVDISCNNLSGILPSWIFKSTEMLSVSRNNFEGEIPVDLCKNDLLTILDLSHNRFSGTIPFCLFNLSFLGSIDLGSNNLTGTIPEASTKYSSFRIIDLSNNQISGGIPKSFYRHSVLAILSLENNKLEGQISSQICQLKKINILDLSHNKFTGSIPSCFNNMSFGGIYSPISEWFISGISGIGEYSYPHFHLNDFRFIGYELSVEEVDEVEFMTKSLSLSYKGDILEYMSGLDLSSNQLMGDIPEQIGDLHTLHSLNLSHNHLNGTIPEGFCNMIQMESLDLSSNNLNGEIPLQLQDLTFLSTFMEQQ